MITARSRRPKPIQGRKIAPICASISSLAGPASCEPFNDMISRQEKNPEDIPETSHPISIAMARFCAIAKVRMVLVPELAESQNSFIRVVAIFSDRRHAASLKEPTQSTSGSACPAMYPIHQKQRLATDSDVAMTSKSSPTVPLMMENSSPATIVPKKVPCSALWQARASFNAGRVGFLVRSIHPCCESFGKFARVLEQPSCRR